MTDKDDGGPAFPKEAYVNPHGVVIHTGTAGMSLRDWFAGQALAGIMVSPDDVPGGASAKEFADIVGVISYAIADGMIKARGQS